MPAGNLKVVLYFRTSTATKKIAVLLKLFDTQYFFFTSPPHKTQQPLNCLSFKMNSYHG